jgi:hypothetical protein
MKTDREDSRRKYDERLPNKGIQTYTMVGDDPSKYTTTILHVL